MMLWTWTRFSTAEQSKVSTCDGPPGMKSWMTRLARGAKCGAVGKSGEAPVAHRARATCARFAEHARKSDRPHASTEAIEEVAPRKPVRSAAKGGWVFVEIHPVYMIFRKSWADNRTCGSGCQRELSSPLADCQKFMGGQRRAILGKTLLCLQWDCGLEEIHI